MPDVCKTRLRWSPARAASGPAGQRPRHRGAVRPRRREGLRRGKNGESMQETLDRVASSRHDQVAHLRRDQERRVKAMIDACLGAFGRIDILVNNVGGSAAGGGGALRGGLGRPDGLQPEKRVPDCKHVLPVMEKQGGGAIVNLASTSGCAGPARRRSATRLQGGRDPAFAVVAVQYATRAFA